MVCRWGYGRRKVRKEGVTGQESEGTEVGYDKGGTERGMKRAKAEGGMESGNTEEGGME